MSAEAFVAALAKHLPPSASRLRVLDIGGQCRETLLALRADLCVRSCSPDELRSDCFEVDSLDAVAALDAPLEDSWLACALDWLRPGGRLIVVLRDGEVSESHLTQLQTHGYIRILVEAALDGRGLLLRGEKAHRTSDTVKRVADVARADADLLDAVAYRRPYLHLLIRQSPNKPVWQLRADDAIQWRALALNREDRTIMLAFSSLPKAVNFLQAATLAGMALGINKVGKFARETASAWDLPLRLNPTLEAIGDERLTWLPVDPADAAAPDE